MPRPVSCCRGCFSLCHGLLPGGPKGPGGPFVGCPGQRKRDGLRILPGRPRIGEDPDLLPRRKGGREGLRPVPAPSGGRRHGRMPGEDASSPGLSGHERRRGNHGRDGIGGLVSGRPLPGRGSRRHLCRRSPREGLGPDPLRRLSHQAAGRGYDRAGALRFGRPGPEHGKA